MKRVARNHHRSLAVLAVLLAWLACGWPAAAAEVATAPAGGTAEPAPAGEPQPPGVAPPEPPTATPSVRPAPAAPPEQQAPSDAPAREPPQPPRCSADPKGVRVTCSDGRVLTVRSAGLALRPDFQCDGPRMECCATGFRSLRDIQLADLLRAARGEDPVCHVLIGEAATNPPSRPWVPYPAAPAANKPAPPSKPPAAARVAGPPALPAPSSRPVVAPAPAPPPPRPCPPGQYLAGGACQDPVALLRTIGRPPVLRDPNRPPLPQARDLVAQLRLDYERTGHCPRAKMDIDVLNYLYQELRRRAAAGSSAVPGVVPDADFTPLVAVPERPDDPGEDLLLPLACGFNARFSRWHETSFHCTAQDQCFAQVNQNLPHNCAALARLDGPGPPGFTTLSDCRGVRSCRDAGRGVCAEDQDLMPLGDGLFLRAATSERTGQTIYLGLVIAPLRGGSRQDRRAARAARTLLDQIMRQIADPADRARLERMLGE